MLKNILDEIEKQTAIELNIDSYIVERVINHKWKTLFESLYVNTEVEDSGLCKFKIRDRKTRAELKKLIDIQNSFAKKVETEESDIKKQTLLRKIKELENQITYLKTKISDES